MPPFARYGYARPSSPCRKCPRRCSRLTQSRGTHAVLPDQEVCGPALAHSFPTHRFIIDRGKDAESTIGITPSQIHDHLLLLHLVDLQRFQGEGTFLAGQPLGGALVAVAFVGVGPGALAGVGQQAVGVDHDVVRETKEVIRGDEDGFVDLRLLYVETLVFGQAEDEGVLVAQVVMRVLGDLNGGKPANHLVESRAD